MPLQTAPHAAPPAIGHATGRQADVSQSATPSSFMPRFCGHRWANVATMARGSAPPARPGGPRWWGASVVEEFRLRPLTPRAGSARRRTLPHLHLRHPPPAPPPPPRHHRRLYPPCRTHLTQHILALLGPHSVAVMQIFVKVRRRCPWGWPRLWRLSLVPAAAVRTVCGPALGCDCCGCSGARRRIHCLAAGAGCRGGVPLSALALWLWRWRRLAVCTVLWPGNRRPLPNCWVDWSAGGNHRTATRDAAVSRARFCSRGGRTSGQSLQLSYGF